MSSENEGNGQAWVRCANEPPLENAFSNTPPASGSGVESPSGHGPNVLEEDEIKNLCKKWNNQRQRAIFLEFQDAESMGNVKDEKTITEMVAALTKGEASPEFITVGYTSRHSIQMAIKIKSTRNPIPIGEIMEKLYKFFDNYRGRIVFDKNVKGTYLDMARKILCPEEDLDVDVKPFVFGEQCKVSGEDRDVLEENRNILFKRIWNAERKQAGHRTIYVGRRQEWIDAAMTSDGSSRKYMRTTKNLDPEEDMAFVLHASPVSRSVEKERLEEEIFLSRWICFYDFACVDSSQAKRALDCERTRAARATSVRDGFIRAGLMPTEKRVEGVLSQMDQGKSVRDAIARVSRGERSAPVWASMYLK